MKILLMPVFIITLLFAPLNRADAQSNVTTVTTETTFKSSDLPQWAKDMRRFDIISFGMFPFSLFFVTFITDMVRWGEANNFDMNDLRYAPWPLKSAGAVEMTTEEYNRTILISAGVSVGIALIDLAIVLIKRSSERRRTESQPSGSFEIDISPYGTEPENDNSEDLNPDVKKEQIE
ncbi:MAG: hypothetical protein FWB77_03405 [Treponema sp.]|nr:hypothetical protein [Treponema sp.]